MVVRKTIKMVLGLPGFSLFHESSQKTIITLPLWLLPLGRTGRFQESNAPPAWENPQKGGEYIVIKGIRTPKWPKHSGAGFFDKLSRYMLVYEPSILRKALEVKDYVEKHRGFRGQNGLL